MPTTRPPSPTSPGSKPAEPPRRSSTRGEASAKPADGAAAKKSTAKKKAVDFETPAESQWHRMISEAAYYLAEKRGFESGSEHEDWLVAEQQVKRILSP